MTAKIINRLIVILVTASLMLLTFIDFKLSPVRVLFAIGLVTILPGYALTTAIFVNTPLGILEKIAFSFGFSLGMTSLGGLLLNYSRWGIQASSWVILLGGVAIVASVITLIRMKYIADVDLRVVHVPLRVDQILLMVLAVMMMTGAYVYARSGAENSSRPTSTRMWMLWTDDSQTEVAMGVENWEMTSAQYRLVISTLQGEIQEWPMITLAPGGVWDVRYEAPPSVSEVDFIKATLYRLDSPEDRFRQVYLRRVAGESVLSANSD